MDERDKLKVQAENNSIAIGEINITGTVTGDIRIGHTIIQAADAQLRHDLGILLKNVETTWIKGVLERSVHEAALLDLGMETREEAVDNPWQMVMEAPDQMRVALPRGKRIKDIFYESNGLLLILGKPGSGKTTTLLQLARDLIAEVDKAFMQPVPVILNLSTWINKEQPLNEWLVAELNSKYRLPKKDGKKWLAERRIVPLLDGLDEVKAENRAACVEQINQLVKNYGLQAVVCSRIQDYMALNVRLGFYGAMYIQPLTPEQVDEYLKSAGDKLASLHATLHADKALKSLAQSPLMLNIMSLAYQNTSAETLSDPALNTNETRRRHLFDTYIARMFKRKAGVRQYDEKLTKRHLSWLARNMQRHNQEVFLIEGLQPSWLSARSWQRVYFFVSRLVNLAIPALSAGLFFDARFGWLAAIAPAGLALGFVDIVRFEWHRVLNRFRKSSSFWWPIINFMILWLIIGLAVWLIVAPTLSLFSGSNDRLINGPIDVLTFVLERWKWVYRFEILLGALLLGAPFALFFGLRGSRQNPEDIQTVEALRWSWRKALKAGLIVWLIAGLIFGLITLSAVVLVAGWSEMLIIKETRNDLIFGLVDGLIFALNYGLIGAIYYGLTREIIDTKSIPNQGIRLSIRNAIIGGLIIGSIGLIIELIIRPAGDLIDVLFYYQPSVELIDRLIAYLIEGLRLGMFLALIGALWYGGLDVIQHYTLRLILIIQGHAPANYARFLDYAVDRIFLQKVGGGYRFIHRLLLEHFAEMYEKEG